MSGVFRNIFTLLKMYVPSNHPSISTGKHVEGDEERVRSAKGIKEGYLRGTQPQLVYIYSFTPLMGYLPTDGLVSNRLTTS